jgi:hypothetical protein
MNPIIIPIHTRTEKSTCPSCGKPESIKETCNHCGYQYERENDGVLVVLFIVILAIVGLFWFCFTCLDWFLCGNCGISDILGNQIDWIKNKRIW